MAQHLGTLDEILEHLSIRRAYFFEVSGKRHGEDASDVEVGSTSQVLLNQDEEDPDHTLSVRLQSRYVTEYASFVADCVVEFGTDDVVTFDSDAVMDFVTQRAIHMVLPYVREAIDHTAVRLRVRPPKVGFAKLTGVELSTLDSEDEAS